MEQRWTISSPGPPSFVAFGPSMFVDLRSVMHATGTFGLVWSSAVAGRVSELRDVVSGFKFLRRGRLASGDLPLVQTHTHTRTTVILV